MLLLAAPVRGAFTETPLTMQETLQLGVTAFTSGDYEGAAAAFDHMAEKFGEEPQYQPLISILLPIHAYACQMTGRPADAIGFYQQYLELEDEPASRRAFVLFSLARAYQQEGEPEKAIATYQEFIETAPDSPEAMLSVMRQAGLYFEIGDNQEGIDRLLGFAASDRAPPSLATQAQLRALQKAIEIDDFAQAQKILFEFDWGVETMPELAVLTFAALDVGNRLMDEGKYAAAIRAYRHVAPARQLIAAQNARLAGLQYAWNERQRQAGQGHHIEAIWSDYYRGLVARVEAQLEGLRESGDYTPGFQMRLGQDFLLDGRAREACIVFRRLAEDDGLDETVRGSAHYRWILAVNALEDWDESLRLARLFLERYPKHPDFPTAMYLIANAYRELKNYRQAIETLSELLDAYPDHRLAGRWLFMRGYNSVLAQDFLPARMDFQAVLTRQSTGILADQARLWDAMSYYFARDYAEAMKGLDAALKDVPKQSQIYPEIVYRRAQTLYSKRDYAEALVATDDFLQCYTDHRRAPEARVLRGDILMGEGRLLEASNQFALVAPEAGALFSYAVFQRGKIQKAMEAYGLMIEHFTNYVRRDDAPEKVRVAEALYWIGWAHEQQGDPAAAFPLFIEALAVHGNDVKAGETIAILQALHKLHTKYHAGELDIVSGMEDQFGLLAESDFEQWLEDQLNTANAKRQWTWLSRINLYRAMLFRKYGDRDREGVALLEIEGKVPLGQLDPEGLATVGDMLTDLELSSASEYYGYLMEKYPRSTQLGAAYYGMARLAMQHGELARAESWLNRFETETPCHPAGVRVKLLRGRLLVQLGYPGQAISILEELLRLKSARGQPHAQALLGIARAYEALNEPGKAIAYYQRVYTLYRAYSDEVVEAYVASAPLFEQRGDLRAAYNSWRELANDPHLAGYEDARAQAAEAMARLEPVLPPAPEPESVADAAESSERKGTPL